MKSYYGEPIGTHQRSFERHHPRPLRPPLPQDWGFATPIQNCSRYYFIYRAHRAVIFTVAQLSCLFFRGFLFIQKHLRTIPALTQLNATQLY